jgi:predicted alpha-1,6-mannanase (GH76 family)
MSPLWFLAIYLSSVFQPILADDASPPVVTHITTEIVTIAVTPDGKVVDPSLLDEYGPVEKKPETSKQSSASDNQDKNNFKAEPIDHAVEENSMVTVVSTASQWGPPSTVATEVRTETSPAQQFEADASSKKPSSEPSNKDSDTSENGSTVVSTATENASAKASSSKSSPSSTSSSSNSPNDCDSLKRITEKAVDSLQGLYNSSSGFYGPKFSGFGNGMWWTSANCLTSIMDYMETMGTHGKYQDILENTYEKAQAFDLSHQGHHESASEVQKSEKTPSMKNGFTNSFSDDEGWWALAWINAFDLSGDNTYLNSAVDIFENMTDAWDDDRCGGGLWWSTEQTYVNAITNELFLSVAASLANRIGDNKSHYLDWAKKEWNWFKDSSMVNGNNLVNDGLDQSTCKNNGKTTWTYNQGVILGGLVELSKADGGGGGDYMAYAKKIASAAIDQLSRNGILHESCEPNCGDGGIFKGIFLRNLIKLQQASPDDKFADFINKNAETIVKNAGDSASFGEDWSNNNHSPTPMSQASAVECLTAALRVKQCGSK